MPSASTFGFRYNIDPEAGLAIAQMEGVLTGEDMLHVLEQVHGDPRWQQGDDAIWDCSHVHSHDITPGQVRPVVLESVESGAGRDVLVPSNGLGDEILAQMLAVYSRRMGKEVRVRHSLADALDYLGLASLPSSLKVGLLG